MSVISALFCSFVETLDSAMQYARSVYSYRYTCAQSVTAALPHRRVLASGIFTDYNNIGGKQSNATRYTHRDVREKTSLCLFLGVYSTICVDLRGSYAVTIRQDFKM
jgi:hypothetical protein